MRQASTISLTAVLVFGGAGCLVLDTDEGPSESRSDVEPGADKSSKPPPSGLRVFTTRGEYRGDLTRYADAGDGVAAADAICQIRADAADLRGTFLAWLSSSEVSATDRIGGDGPWTRMDGEVAFANRAQLMTEPSVPLILDERGEDLYECCGNVSAWTGTHPGGFKHEMNCDDFTSEASRGIYGWQQKLDFSWTKVGDVPCSTPMRLLCFEVP